jgi:pyrroline-5-carboxylate reductase
VAGAGELVQQSGEPVEQLRQNVTSPGGTTLAALEVLMAEDGLQPLMTQAIVAASRRSRELA